MNRKAIQTVIGIIFYIFAGLLAIYAIWSFSTCADIISQAKAAGQLAASGNEYDIASFYMGNCGQYVVFALMMAAMGFILQGGQAAQNKPDSSRPSKNDAGDDALDEWFSEEETSSSPSV